MEKEITDSTRAIYVEELVDSLMDRSDKAPKKTRKGIRKLKQEGEFQKAAQLRKTALKKRADTRTSRAFVALELTRDKLDEIEDPREITAQRIKIVWLLEATHQIGSEDRMTEVGRIYDNANSCSSEYLETRWQALRAEVAPLMPRKKVKF